MTVTMTVERDEFEAWWIKHGWQLCCSLTQDKNSPIDFAELVWLAAVKQGSRESPLESSRENLLEKGVDKGVTEV
jgi:hypothetical protein